MFIAVHEQRHQKNWELIVVSGHEDQQEHEQYALVCAQVSAISVGILNSIDQQCPNSCELTMEDGFVSIHVKESTPLLQSILETFVIQLDTVAQVNSKIIKIKKVEV
ncbi:MAG: ribosomal-processing cysteine protease Prp [Absicoccus sp.]|uniref:ribosomal-processing cysteine protease Prp n=1 Tax=Absicoccus sp. TaxID=2718527 RepID=UPI002A755A4E|nr:ribosomal-processing cysteine protease Prp [Absicoccus sp.]MDY3035125.1 ribosomal-processing cysteine protease Prp [Absicoccus sp.]